MQQGSGVLGQLDGGEEICCQTPALARHLRLCVLDVGQASLIHFMPKQQKGADKLEDFCWQIWVENRSIPGEHREHQTSTRIIGVRSAILKSCTNLGRPLPSCLRSKSVHT